MDLNSHTVKSEIFARILFLPITFKRHVCYVKNFQLMHDLATSVTSDFSILGGCKAARK